MEGRLTTTSIRQRTMASTKNSNVARYRTFFYSVFQSRRRLRELDRQALRRARTVDESR